MYAITYVYENILFPSLEGSGVGFEVIYSIRDFNRPTSYFSQEEICGFILNKSVTFKIIKRLEAVVALEERLASGRAKFT